MLGKVFWFASGFALSRDLIVHELAESKGLRFVIVRPFFSAPPRLSGEAVALCRYRSSSSRCLLPLQQTGDAHCQKERVQRRREIELFVNIEADDQHVAHNPEPPVLHDL